MQLFVPIETYTRQDGIEVTKFKPTTDIHIKAISLEDGTVAWKRVLEFSKHENIRMFKIRDCKNRFKEFWVSSDHSMVVYDHHDHKFKKVSPIVVKDNLTRYSLVRHLRNNVLEFIPCIDILITYDPEKTVGYDFTVEDFYTFATSDNIFVQDTMAVYCSPVPPRELYVEDNLVDPNFHPFELGLEYVLAIYQLSLTEEGRKTLSDIIGIKIDKPITKKDLDEIIAQISMHKAPKKVIDILYKLQRLVVIADTTLSLEDFDLGVNKDDIEELPDEEKVKVLLQRTIEAGRKKRHLTDIVDSGARGKWIQVQQTAVSKGLVVDALNRPVGFVKHSFLEGLSDEELLIATHGTRKGLLDTAVQTAESGYLFRKLVYALIDQFADLNNTDCGAEPVLELELTRELAYALRLRVVRIDDHDVVIKRPSDFIGKRVQLYSPIGCRSKHYCLKCCGGLVRLLSKKNILPVGVIAAQTIGERTTQLVLRSFHTSGTAEKIKDGLAEDIVTDLSSLDRILMSKESIPQQRLLDILIELFVKNYKIQMIWTEILVAALYCMPDMTPARLYGEEGHKQSLFDLINKNWLHGLCFGWTKDRLVQGLSQGFEIDEQTLVTKLLFV